MIDEPIMCWLSPTGEIVPVGEGEPHGAAAQKITGGKIGSMDYLLHNGWLIISARNRTPSWAVWGLRVPCRDGASPEQQRILDEWGITDIHID